MTHDQIMQRLQVAQDLVQSLLTMMSLPTPPDRALVQSVLDVATNKIKAIDAQAVTAPAPFVLPQLVPPTAAPATIPTPATVPTTVPTASVPAATTTTTTTTTAATAPAATVPPATATTIPPAVTGS